jgi:hypothetical protein
MGKKGSVGVPSGLKRPKGKNPNVQLNIQFEI